MRSRSCARIVEPDIAVVTSIGEEHLEGLGDLAGVLREEAACIRRRSHRDRSVGAAGVADAAQTPRTAR